MATDIKRRRVFPTSFVPTIVFLISLALMRGELNSTQRGGEGLETRGMR